MSEKHIIFVHLNIFLSKTWKHYLNLDLGIEGLLQIFAQKKLSKA